MRQVAPAVTRCSPCATRADCAECCSQFACAVRLRVMATWTVLLTEHERIADNALLQRWLRQGDELPAAGSSLATMLADSFQGISADNFPAAALLRQWQCGDAGTRFWVCAEPAIVQAEMVTARLLACGAAAGLNEKRSTVLATALAPLCAEHGWQLDAPSPQRWYLSRSDAVEVPTLSPPRQALGDDLKTHLPAGPQGRPWRQLFNDVQVELHNLPDGSAPPAQVSAQMNALWFWGAGILPSQLKSSVNTVYSDDDLLHALAAACGSDARSLAGFSAHAGQGDVLVDLRHQRDAPLEEALQLLAQTLGSGNSLLLHLESGEKVQLRRRHRWRLWRR